MLHRSRDGLVMSELGNGVRDIFCILNNKKGLGGEPEGMKVFVYLSRGEGWDPRSPGWDPAHQSGTRLARVGAVLSREGPEY